MDYVHCNGLLHNDEFSHERLLTLKGTPMQVSLRSAQTGKPIFYLTRFQAWTDTQVRS